MQFSTVYGKSSVRCVLSEGLILGTTLLLTVGLISCGLETPIAQLFNQDHPEPQEVTPSEVTGAVPSLPGATIRLISAGGQELGTPTPADGEGAFLIELSGTMEYRSVRVVAQRGEVMLLGLASHLPRARQVAGAPQTVNVGDLNASSTARVLALAESAAQLGLSLSAANAQALEDAQRRLTSQRSAAYRDLLEEVQLWIELANTAGQGPPMLDAGLAPNPEFLQLHELEEHHAAEMIRLAALDADLQFCFSPDTIRVIFTVDMNPGTLDGNCSPINRFKWASDSPGKRMFITGGVHEDMDTLTDAVRDRVNRAFASWEPNRIPMYDDGTSGDAVAGDNIWTYVVDLPRVEGGLKIGYKYTWGTPGDGWTGAEEWPGNQRLLHVLDINGDGLVTRHDNFGDEATNKDRANARRGGTGSIGWDTDADGDCIPDVRERPVDTTGDCVPDSWPSSGPVGPILGEGENCAIPVDVDRCWTID